MRYQLLDSSGIGTKDETLTRMAAECANKSRALRTGFLVRILAPPLTELGLVAHFSYLIGGS